MTHDVPPALRTLASAGTFANNFIVPSAVRAKNVTEGEANPSERHGCFFRVDMSHGVTGSISAGFDSAIAVRHARGCASNWGTPTVALEKILKLHLVQVSFQRRTRLQPADLTGAGTCELTLPQVKFAIADLDLLALRWEKKPMEECQIERVQK